MAYVRDPVHGATGAGNTRGRLARAFAALRNSSGTGPRFALLIILVTASSFATLTSVLDQLSVLSESGRPGAGLYGTPSCLYAAGFDPSSSDLGNLRATMSRPDALLKCLGDRPVGYRALIATAVLLAVAALVYWWMPKARDWRRRMVPVEAVDADGTLRAELAALCERTGVRSSLRFRVDPARMTSGASAYGRTGNYTVCLHVGLLARRGTDPEGFRAVVLHELAHVHHRDVDYAYASTALWRVYVLLALLPHFAGIGWIFLLAFSGTDSPWWPGAAPTLLAEVFVGLLLTALLHLARADLLRRRELHADLQAVAWGAHPGSWDRSDPAGAVAPALRRLTTLLRTHPSWAERRGVLADAGRGFRVSPLEMFLTGASASLLYSALGLTSSALLPETVGWSYALVATVAVVTPVLCAGLGLPLVRASDPARGYVRSAVASGLWLGCGLLVGEVTASGQYRLDVLVSQPEYLLAFLFIGAVPALWWSHSLQLALGLPRRGQRWAAAVVCALVTAAVLLTGLLWWRLGGERIAMGYGDAGEGLAAMYARMVPGNWRDYGLDLSTLTVGMPLLTPLSEERLADATAYLMWFVPLVLLLVRGPGLRMRRTLGAGVAGGLVSWAGLAAAMYAMYLQRPATLKERAGPFLVVHAWWMIVTVLAACGLTAALVAAYSRHHWLLRALIAAQITQLMAYAGVFVLYSADGCLGPLNTVLDACQWRPHNGLTVDKGVTHLTLTGAVVGAACAALMGAGAAWAARRLRRRPATSDLPAVPAPTAPRRRRWALLTTGTVLALGVPALLLTVVTILQTTSSPSSVVAGSSGDTAATGDKKPDRLSPGQAAKLHTWQVWSWMYHGGALHAQQIETAWAALAHRILLLSAQSRDKNGQVWVDEKRFHGPCGTLGKRVEEAQGYFRVPDPDLQTSWSDTLGQLRRGAQKCQQATVPPTGETRKAEEQRGALFTTSLNEIAKGMRSLSTTLQDITKAATSKTTK
ncbi:M48 family metalloprotease [Streptomyces sp. A1-5]|nr:M48 family metalloprotease [Streptomyces sp. A1-5]